MSEPSSCENDTNPNPMNIDYKIGDCREVLANGFDENSFDACVTDPPYGLEFMGKEWDNLSDTERHFFGENRIPGTGIEKAPRFFGKDNPRCLNCGHYRYSGTPCECGNPTFEPWKSREMQAWHLLWAKQVYRVLKPGGYLLAFGGTRTYHRMVCAVEDAGFEIRDTIAWIYGSGFPKSLDISKQIDKLHGAEREVVAENPNVRPACNPQDNTLYEYGATGKTEGITAPVTSDAKKWSGYGTALKPAVEPIVVARKPISEKNVAMNVLTHGVGGINVDGCRVEAEPSLAKNWDREQSPSQGEGWGYKAVNLRDRVPQGRFPANIILECTCEKVIPGKVGTPSLAKHEHTFGDGEIYGTAKESVKTVNYGDTAPIHTNPNCPCYVLDGQSGETSSKVGIHTSKPGAIYGMGKGLPSHTGLYGHNDKGGSSRFFYVAKASRRERWFYCSVCKKAYSGDKREAHKKHSMHCLDCGVDYEPVHASQNEIDPDCSLEPFVEIGNESESADEDVHKSHRTKSNLLFHVTQKPVELIRYLIRLVTPPGGSVLDPFLGSGTSLEAGYHENVSVYGIEIGSEYDPLIKGRLNALPKNIYQFTQETE
ncbi:MAG: DNA methyltransferase [Candidatus Thorarchaeota archaeon]|jgi:site-specific DNA-methyltransferase (adenine-specific)